MYSHYDVELSIYHMAEDVAEISEVMQESVRFRADVIDRWMMKIWAGILVISLTVIYIRHILKSTKNSSERSLKNKRRRYKLPPTPSQLLKLLQKEAYEKAVLDRFCHNEHDEVTLIPLVGNEYQVGLAVSPKVVELES